MEWRKIHLDLPTFPNIDFAILRMQKNNKHTGMKK